MDPRFLITVFGLFLATSGMPDEPEPYLDRTMSDWKACESQRNAAIAIYRRLAEDKKFDNIALSLTDVFISLVELDAYTRNQRKVSLFLDPFRIDTNSNAAVARYNAMLFKFDRDSNEEITFDSYTIVRRSCLVSSNNSRVSKENNSDDETKGNVFSDIADAVMFLEDWYRDLYVDVDFDTTEFGGEECIIFFGGGRFHHEWQQSNRCISHSPFFIRENMYENDVTYVNVIDDFPYGELPELNAAYIEVPWTAEAVNIGLYVILPNAVDGLKELESKITGDTIKKMVNESKKSRVDVTLPEFTMTRNYHLMPIITNVSKVVHPNQFLDLVNAVTIEAFQASDEECCSTDETPRMVNAGLPEFNADHPFLIVIVYKGNGKGDDSFIAGMAAHRVPEQWPHLPDNEFM